MREWRRFTERVALELDVDFEESDETQDAFSARLETAARFGALFLLSDLVEEVGDMRRAVDDLLFELRPEDT